ncbi:NUDIX domain-containing protein [Bacillus salacetis]|uniref:NUDIX domain-containing protein n=1 Tax=Bacillus salacetis TaxID=2315464 RepID=A0A3A1R296_9BACI|nr:NUDIX domain-containing protein [Bacillus salacetis]RIW32721.1 NUDIX domain-containing protein [Bacillus salacetis]
MSRTVKVQWGSGRVELTWSDAAQLPPLEKITSVHGCCFHQGKVLLVNIKGRGFNFPGGHVEGGETPEQAFHREVLEEGWVKGRVRHVGMIKVSHRNNPQFDPKGKYPLIGYQVFYRMDIEEMLPFQRNNESSCRIWAEPSEVPYVINDHELALEALNEAVKGGLNTVI